MAIIQVITNYGEQLRAQNLVDDSTFQVVNIKAGGGHVTTAAAAQALTDIVTPFVPARENANPPGVTLPDDPVAQFRYRETASVNYEIKEYGVFVAGGMTHYVCRDDGGTLHEKTAGLALDVGLYFAVASGDQAAFTFQDPLTVPVATPPTNNSAGVPGIVRLASAAEFLAALTGTDPADGIQHKVVDLQTIYDNRAAIVPPAASPWKVGDLKPTISSTAEDGWLMTDGAKYLRTDHPDLAAECGTTYMLDTDTDGATHFRVPNYQRRALVGAGGAGSTELASALGSMGGAETHTLTTAELPSHGHGSAGAHTHGLKIRSGAGGGLNTIYPSTAPTNTLTNLMASAGAHSHANAGGGGAHNNLPPSATVNWLIKT